MRSILIAAAAAAIGGGALALTASLPAGAMPLAQLKQASVSHVETVGWCHRRWRRHAWYHSYAWYGGGYGYSGTLLYFGPKYRYANRKLGW